MVAVVSVSEATTTMNLVYGANGNLISGDGNYYEYNDANQLVKVRFGDQSGPVIAQYFYDYTGQRIKKIENGVTTYYIGKHYETTVDGDKKTNTSYYFANGQRVAKKNSAGKMYFYHSDHLGGTNAVTDSTGHLAERTNYYPFGEIREGGNEKYSFTGKEKDNLTDNYYFEARYYNPRINHFTQADTISPNLFDPQELNRYSYVRNNPLKYVDPSGHESWLSQKWHQLKEWVGETFGTEEAPELVQISPTEYKRASPEAKGKMKQSVQQTQQYIRENNDAQREYNDITHWSIKGSTVVRNIAKGELLKQIPGWGFLSKLDTARKVGSAAGQKMNEEFDKRGPTISHDLYDEDGEMQRRYQEDVTKGCVWASCYLTRQGTEIMSEGAKAGANEAVSDFTYGIIDLND
jgi:RHS repeat-associated protein